MRPFSWGGEASLRTVLPHYADWRSITPRTRSPALERGKAQHGKGALNAEQAVVTTALSNSLNLGSEGRT